MRMCYLGKRKIARSGDRPTCGQARERFRCKPNTVAKPSIPSNAGSGTLDTLRTAELPEGANV